MNPIAGGEFPWYNIIGLVVLAALFMYFGLAAASFPPSARKKLPTFVFNKKICFFIAGVIFAMSLAKLLGWM
jgi:hypothetical protein